MTILTSQTWLPLLIQLSRSRVFPVLGRKAESGLEHRSGQSVVISEIPLTITLDHNLMRPGRISQWLIALSIHLLVLRCWPAQNRCIKRRQDSDTVISWALPRVMNCLDFVYSGSKSTAHLINSFEVSLIHWLICLKCWFQEKIECYFVGQLCTVSVALNITYIKVIVLVWIKKFIWYF